MAQNFSILWFAVYVGSAILPHHEDHEGNEESNTNLNFFPFVPFESFVVNSILSSLVAASPRWVLRAE